MLASINRNKSLSKWLSSYSNLKPLQSTLNISLILLGPILAIATYLFLGPFNVAGQSIWLRFFLLLDLVYVLLIVGIVLVRILYVLSQRRSRLAGSKLHFRLAGVFTTMSLLPTITVAVFATVSINLGLEAWFSERVQSVVGTSLSAARAYADEQESALVEDILSVAEDLQNFRKNKFFIEDDDLRSELASLQLQLQRGLKEAFILNGLGNIELRGQRSYLFDFEIPKKEKKHLIEKASICINGISLTISKVTKKGFQVWIIPHTYKETNLSTLIKSSLVNIEIDILSKYVRNYFNEK